MMNEAGFDAAALELDLSLRDSVKGFIEEAGKAGEITMLVNAAGVSPSQASVETILKVDLYGTAVLLEEVGKVFKIARAMEMRCFSPPERLPPPSPTIVS